MSTDILVDYPAGSVIFHEGVRGDCMFVVKKGEVEIIVKGHSVETVGVDGFFGEMALIDSGPRSASAVVKTDCTLMVVNHRRFAMLVQQTPSFALSLLQALSRRIRRHDGRLY